MLTKKEIIDIVKAWVKWGLIIGIPLMIGVYLFLWTQGNQLKAQSVANATDEWYQAKPSVNPVIGSDTLIEGEEADIQPAVGYRYVQPSGLNQ